MSKLLNDDREKPIYSSTRFSDVLAYAEVKDFLRVLFDDKKKLFIYSDGWDYIHIFLGKAALDYGLYPQDMSSKLSKNLGLFEFAISKDYQERLLDQDSYSKVTEYNGFYIYTREGCGLLKNSVFRDIVKPYKKSKEITIEERIKRLEKKLEEKVIPVNKELTDTKLVTSAHELNEIIKHNTESRIVYDKEKNWFLIGNGENSIHIELINDALKDGIYPPFQWNGHTIDGNGGDGSDDDGGIFYQINPKRFVLFRTSSDSLNGEDYYYDRYQYCYIYKDYCVFTRDTDFEETPLYKLLGEPIDIENNGNVLEDEGLTESILDAKSVGDELMNIILKNPTRKELSDNDMNICRGAMGNTGNFYFIKLSQLAHCDLFDTLEKLGINDAPYNTFKYSNKTNTFYYYDPDNDLDFNLIRKELESSPYFKNFAGCKFDTFDEPDYDPELYESIIHAKSNGDNLTNVVLKNPRELEENNIERARCIEDSEGNWYFADMFDTLHFQIENLLKNNVSFPYYDGNDSYGISYFDVEGNEFWYNSNEMMPKEKCLEQYYKSSYLKKEFPDAYIRENPYGFNSDDYENENIELDESIKDLNKDFCDTKIITSAYEMKQYMNTHKPIRVVYDNVNDWYLVNDANKAIHSHILDDAISVGLYNEEGVKCGNDLMYTERHIQFPLFNVSDKLDEEYAFDGYAFAYVYDNFVIYDRYGELSNTPLYEVLGEPLETVRIDGYDENEELDESKLWINDKILYHGTNRNFDTFKVSKKGTFGKGIYLSPNYNTAQKFGNKLLKVKVNLKNPIYLSHETDDKIKKLIMYNKIDELQKMGYDGIIVGDEEYCSEVVVWNPKDVKIIKNLDESVDKIDILKNPTRKDLLNNNLLWCRYCYDNNGNYYFADANYTHNDIMLNIKGKLDIQVYDDMGFYDANENCFYIRIYSNDKEEYNYYLNREKKIKQSYQLLKKLFGNFDVKIFSGEEPFDIKFDNLNESFVKRDDGEIGAYYTHSTTEFLNIANNKYRKDDLRVLYDIDNKLYIFADTFTAIHLNLMLYMILFTNVYDNIKEIKDNKYADEIVLQDIIKSKLYLASFKIFRNNSKESDMNFLNHIMNMPENKTDGYSTGYACKINDSMWALCREDEMPEAKQCPLLQNKTWYELSNGITQLNEDVNLHKNNRVAGFFYYERNKWEMLPRTEENIDMANNWGKYLQYQHNAPEGWLEEAGAIRFSIETNDNNKTLCVIESPKESWVKPFIKRLYNKFPEEMSMVDLFDVEYQNIYDQTQWKRFSPMDLD